MKINVWTTAIGAAISLAVGLVPAAASAQGTAQIAQAGLPSYAREERTIRGRIVSINGDDLRLRDEHGNLGTIRLHDGTVINPTGLKLVVGMNVSVLGYGDGATFSVTQIDTPYNTYASGEDYGAPAPAYGAPYPAYPYYGPPYPAYGYYPPYPPYAYYGPAYWGPAYSFGIGFGGWGFGFHGRWGWR
jgi:hypothetical protein